MVDSSKSLLIIGHLWPEPNSSAAGRRMMQIIHAFLDDGWSVSFASSADQSPYSEDLSNLGVSTKKIEINSSSFDDYLSEIHPDVVLFDRFMTEEQFGWRVADKCPYALRILDTEDLHFLRRAREKLVRQDRPTTRSDLLNETAVREIASIYRSDLSLIISEAEMKLLTEEFNVDAELLHYLPFLLDPVRDKDQEEWRSFEEKKHFIWIGNFYHEPNWNAVIYLKESIWPGIRNQLPDAELHIYGAYTPHKVEQLHQPNDGFLIKGRADSAKEVVEDARVCLAPLRMGAGLKGKLVEAMECGTPSITTSIGAEGINGNLDWPGFIEDSPRKFVETAVNLYSNQAVWEKCRKRGATIINQRFDKSVYKNAFMDRIILLQKDIESHRQKNFTGMMLRHHTTASTKYMSRWIEEKNKK